MVISAINNAIPYNYYMNGGSSVYNIPVGAGVMYFFRGNRASAAVGVETQPSYTTPITVTTVATGSLNQGQIIVHDWYTPTSRFLGCVRDVRETGRCRGVFPALAIPPHEDGRTDYRVSPRHGRVVWRGFSEAGTRTHLLP